MTGCVCDKPGFCERHHVMKGPHWHHLCQTSEKQWKRWEAGVGFGQAIAEKNAAATARNCAKKFPSVARRAWNLATSLASFAADGFQLVDKDEYERRLSICDACGMRKGNSCAACGCSLALKAKGRAFQCPLGWWKAPL